MFKKKNLVGLTLMECMISIVLALMIVSMVFSIFMAAQKNFSTQHDFIDLLENARIAKSILRENIRQAGFAGCAKVTDEFPLVNHTAFVLDKKNPLRVLNNAFVVWFAGERKAVLSNAMTDLMSMEVEGHVSANDVLLMTDCKSADVFSVQAIRKINQRDVIMANHKLSKLYGQNAMIYPLEINHVYLSGAKLFMHTIQDVSIDLLDDVSHMTIQQGSGVSIAVTLFAPKNKVVQKKWYLYATPRDE